MTFHRACNSVQDKKESGRSTATFQRWTYAMSRQAQGYMFLAFAMVLVGSTVVASKFIAAALHRLRAHRSSRNGFSAEGPAPLATHRFIEVT